MQKSTEAYYESRVFEMYVILSGMCGLWEMVFLPRQVPRYMYNGFFSTPDPHLHIWEIRGPLQGLSKPFPVRYCIMLDKQQKWNNWRNTPYTKLTVCYTQNLMSCLSSEILHYSHFRNKTTLELRPPIAWPNVTYLCHFASTKDHPRMRTTLTLTMGGLNPRVSLYSYLTMKYRDEGDNH